MEPIQSPAANLPADLPDQIERKEFYNLLEKLNNKVRLSDSERRRLRDLAQKLTGQRTQETDPDWWKLAEDAGAFLSRGIDRSDKETVRRRIQQVTEWIVFGKSFGEQCHLAAKLWGVGYRQLARYRKVATERMVKEHDARRTRVQTVAERQYAEAFATARRLGNANAMVAAAEALVKMYGANAPVVQKMEFAGHDGGPLGIFDVPPKQEGKTAAEFEAENTTQPTNEDQNPVPLVSDLEPDGSGA